jgi:hypothetical protein
MGHGFVLALAYGCGVIVRLRPIEYQMHAGKISEGEHYG